MKQRFPIGLTFKNKRFPQAKELTEYVIDDVIRHISVKTGKIVALEYILQHDFNGQFVTSRVGDTHIAKAIVSYSPEYSNLVTG